MNDLETRLRDTLAERAAAAPDALDLAAGARRRLRRRRTTWAVAATAVVAAAVPLGLAQLSLSSDGGGQVADDPTTTTGLPPGVVETGYRAESWHDVTFEVPVDWGYGSTGAWCADNGGQPSTPVVQRPGTMSPAIACMPASGYGVTVGSAAAFDPAVPSGDVWQYDTAGVDQAMYPDGAWLGVWYDDEVVVTVAAKDRADAQRLIDSVERFTGVDPNGCPVMLGDAEGLRPHAPYDAFSMCRYDAEDLLIASRRLIGTAASDAQDALFSSPRRTADYDCPTEDLSPTVLLSAGGYVATAVTGASCPGWNGLFLNGVVRELTPAAERHLDLWQLPVPVEE